LKSSARHDRNILGRGPFSPRSPLPEDAMRCRLGVVGACAALALAGCTSNQEVADQRCRAVTAGAHDQCVADELAKLAKAQEPPRSKDGGGY
jgi:hypothetical protein